jgi:hypothetical protein
VLGISLAWSTHLLHIPGMFKLLDRSKNLLRYLPAILIWLFCIGGLEVLDGSDPEKILIGPFVGIEYAAPEHVHAQWTFAIAGSPWISAPKNTLRPP